MGLVLLVVAPVICWNPVENWSHSVYWYQYRPTSWVMGDLKHGSGQPAPANNPLDRRAFFGHGWLSENVDLARVALDELLRRDKLGKLSPEYRQEIDELAMANMSAPITTPVQYYLNDELNDRLIEGRLTAEEQATIFQRAVTMTCSAGPTVMLWDDVPVRIGFQTCLPNSSHNGWGIEATYKSVRIDGREANWSERPQWAQPRSATLYGAPTNVERLIPCSTPGLHRIDLDVQIEIHAGSTAYPDRGPVVHSEVRTLSASFSVMPPTTWVKVCRLIRDPQHEAGHYLPVRWLTIAVECGWTFPRDLAAGEMMRRGRLGQLTNDQDDHFIDQLLAIQKDRDQPWSGAFGDYIESRRASGKLPDNKWRQYGNQQLNFFLRARAEIRQGDPLPIEMITVARRGNSKAAPFTASQWHLEYGFSQDIPGPWNLDPWGVILVPNNGREFGCKTAARFPEAPIGRHTLQAKLKAFYLTWTDRPQNMEIPRDYDLGEVAFTIVPRTAKILIPIDDPGLEKQMERSIVVSRLTRYRDGSLLFSMRANHPPIDLAFHFSIQAGGQEWNVADIFIPADSDKELGHHDFLISDATQMPARDLTFKFTSAPDLERQSAGNKKYWSKDITIRGLSIASDDYVRSQR
jgi:hypothetical protein